MEELTTETERKGRDCASLLIDWMQPCFSSRNRYFVADSEFLLGELFYTGAGGNNFLGLRAQPGFSRYFFWQAEAMRRNKSCKAGDGVFLWLAGLRRPGLCCVGSARNQCYIMTVVLLSLLRAFLLSPNQTRKPFVFPLFHLSSLLFCSFSPKSGPNKLYLVFPPYFFLLVLVFWLTGYNLHMYFVLLYETYIRHHHHLTIINNVIFSRTGFAGSSKKKEKDSKVCTCYVCTCTCTYQAYHIVVRD